MLREKVQPEIEVEIVRIIKILYPYAGIIIFFEQVENNLIITNVVNGFILREDIFGLFNFFEQIAYVVDKDIADKESIEKSLKELILRWHKALENFHIASIKYFGYDSWPPLSKILEEWGKVDWRKRVEEHINFFNNSSSGSISR